MKTPTKRKMLPLSFKSDKVLPCWKFYDYVSDGGRGRNQIRYWLNGLSKGAQAAIDYKLRIMETTEKWSPKWFKRYRRLAGIWELVIPHDRVQYRPLCTRSGIKIIILVGTTERDGQIPEGDLVVAQQRFTDWERNSNHAKRHVFDSEKNMEIVPEQEI